jgi:hypothetical protein
MGQPIGDPRDPDIDVEQDFQLAIISEEMKEFRHAVAGLHKDDQGVLVPFESKKAQIAAIADGIGDAIYTLLGAAAKWGLDMGPVWEAIHESNMSKTPNLLGKAIKGKGFVPVNLEAVLEESAQEFRDYPDNIGDNVGPGGAYWPTPRKTRIGGEQAKKAELDEVNEELRLLEVEVSS